MTTASQSVRLTPEEYKAICLKNVEQLHAFLARIEVPTNDHFELIDRHMARWGMFMKSWGASGPKAESEEPKPQEEQSAAPVTNGEAPKKKPGWPKGKKRTPRVPAEAATVQ